MIAEFVKRWDARKGELAAAFAAAHPGSYDGIVQAVIAILHNPDDVYDSPNPDPSRITAIDHGDYQGDRLFVIAAAGYQPSQYWAMSFSYGSCSHCDSFQAIRDNGESRYDDDGNELPPSAGQVRQYMAMALHVVQALKEI